MKHANTWLITATVIACTSFAGWGAARAVASIKFDQQVEGHLKLAADANTIELSQQEMVIAIAALDARGTCDGPGHTSVLYETPDEDVGFWCTNLRATLDDLSDAGTVDNLTESNMLIKVRETIIDHGADGVRVTAPSGITIYPSNAAYAWWAWLSLIVAGGLWAWLAVVLVRE